MLTKLQLLSSASAIGIAIGSVVTTIVTVQANPSIPTGGNTIPARESIVDRTSKPRVNSTKSIQPPVTTVSGTAETRLVEHLVARKVEFYGAYWCEDCQKQKSLFGAEAAAKLPYVECDADGEKSQRRLCKFMNIQTFPTWMIDRKYFTGIRDLKELAKLTGYQGSMNFKYRK
jgi:glutaredoxin